jgi:molybdopterin synthase catalytic subunit
MADVVARLVAEHAGDASSGSTGTAGEPVRIWAAHRIGMLEIGDPALVCAVSAAHRGQAFAVCSELVDRIKEQVPIWKEQFFSDGTVEWVGAGG